MAVDLSFFGGTEAEIEEEVGIEIPDVGGGDFNRGLTSLWTIQPLYRTGVLAETDLDGDGIDYILRRELGSGNLEFFFRDREVAKSVWEGYGGAEVPRYQFGPELVYHMMPDLSQVVGWNSDRTPEEVFQYGADRVVGMNGWKSKSYYRFQLITLPSIVQSVAVAAGAIEAPIYDFNVLAGDPTNSVVSQAMELVGAEMMDGSFVKADDVADCVLAKARQKLWVALGAKPAQWMDSKHGKFPQDSAIHRILLRVATPKTVWVTIAQVPDPLGPREGDDRKNYPIPVMTHLFADKESAEKFYGDDSAGPAIPAIYVEAGLSRSEWIDTLREYLGESLDKPTPAAKKSVQMKKKALIDMGLTFEEVEPWIEELTK